MSKQKDYPFEVNFSNVIDSLRDRLSLRGFSMFTRGSPRDQHARLFKENTAEIILRMQLIGKISRISLVSSKFTNIDSDQQAKFISELWQIIDSAAPQNVKAIAKSPSIEALIRSNLSRYGTLDTEKFSADTGNDLTSVTQAAQMISDGRQFVLTDDNRRIFARGKVREMMLSGFRPSKREVPPSAPSLATCPKCGQRTRPGESFCTACGTKLK